MSISYPSVVETFYERDLLTQPEEIPKVTTKDTLGNGKDIITQHLAYTE
jgi:hypothetical protein